MAILVNGVVVERIEPTNRRTDAGGFESSIDVSVSASESSWVAARVFEDRPDGRIRFAHSSPVHIKIPGKPNRPRREEAEYLVDRMRQELERNAHVLRAEDLQEYKDALRAYEKALDTAR